LHFEPDMQSQNMLSNDAEQLILYIKICILRLLPLQIYYW